MPQKGPGGFIVRNEEAGEQLRDWPVAWPLRYRESGVPCFPSGAQSPALRKHVLLTFAAPPTCFREQHAEAWHHRMETCHRPWHPKTGNMPPAHCHRQVKIFYTLKGMIISYERHSSISNWLPHVILYPNGDACAIRLARPPAPRSIFRLAVGGNP